MKRRMLITAALICIVLTITALLACNQRLDGNGNTPTVDVSGLIPTVDKSIKDKDGDASYDESNAQTVVFSEGGASASGAGVSVDGADVTITGSGTFIITGNCSDGSLTVNAGSSKLQLVLAGLELTNADGPAIYVKSAKKVTITLKDGAENMLADASGYTLADGDANVDGAIFSKADLVINGEGSLEVNGNCAHGIVSKDGIVISNAKITVSAAAAGICGKDFIKISGADITVNAGSDALKSDNELDANMGYIYIQDGKLNLKSVNDAIQAFNIVSIEGGEFDITTTSTSSSQSAKGIKGVGGVHITGGSFKINSEDDGVHSDANVLIEGGSLEMTSGDDGIHANETLHISNGNILIKNSYEGIEATDIVVSGGYIDITSSDDGMNAAGGNDSNTGVSGRPGMDMFGDGTGTITVSGGYIIMHNEGDGVDANGSLYVSGGVILVDGPSRSGNGSFDYGSSASITGGVVITLGVSDMAQNFTEAAQGSILVSSNGYFTAGTTLSLCDEKGNVVLAFTSTKSFSGALFSSPDIEKGKTYTFYTGATVDGLDENGYARNTTQTGGTSCGSITVDDYISGQGSGTHGGGGMHGGRPW